MSHLARKLSAASSCACTRRAAQMPCSPRQGRARCKLAVSVPVSAAGDNGSAVHPAADTQLGGSGRPASACVHQRCASSACLSKVCEGFCRDTDGVTNPCCQHLYCTQVGVCTCQKPTLSGPCGRCNLTWPAWRAGGRGSHDRQRPADHAARAGRHSEGAHSSLQCCSHAYTVASPRASHWQPSCDARMRSL